MKQLSERLGTHHLHVYRMAREGLTPTMADKVACSLGLHPSELWDEWWDVA